MLKFTEHTVWKGENKSGVHMHVAGSVDWRLYLHANYKRNLHHFAAKDNNKFRGIFSSKPTIEIAFIRKYVVPFII